MALERPYKSTGLREAQAGLRACVALERLYKTTAREAQAGKRDRAPELMRGQPAWRLNAL